MSDLARPYNNTLHHKLSAEKEGSIEGDKRGGREDDMKGSTVRKLPYEPGQAGGLIAYLSHRSTARKSDNMATCSTGVCQPR